ncbi:MAG: OmpH family outer membrane protein [Bacteroidales bacterium]|nr:OmpH family outer membrane protein [Bacteroidales bacterium]
MKKVYLLVGGVLFSTIMLFNQCTSDNSSSNKPVVASPESFKDLRLPIAIVNVDSLLDRYAYAKDLSETLLRKQEGSRATINQKARELRSEMEEFQRKIDNNAFLSRDRAQQENDRLLRKQQELQQLDERMTQDFIAEQQKLNQMLRDSIDSSIDKFNKDRKYHLILSNSSGDNVLYYEPSYDITTELIDFMNARYSPAGK